MTPDNKQRWTDKGKGIRQKDSNERGTKEKVHNDIRTELKDGQRKTYTKTKGENSQMDKGQCAQRHKERTHRWTKENVNKDTRRELTDGQRKTCTKTQGENSQMDKGKCAQKHNDSREGQRSEREHMHTPVNVRACTHTQTEVLKSGNNMPDVLSEDIWCSRNIKSWW
jgi:hypothetical protein